VVLIVGAGYKSYKFNDLPSPTEGGVTFLVGSIFTGLLAFMGGFDAWSSDLQGLLGPVATEGAKEKEPEIAGIVNSVSDSMKSMKSWFTEEVSATDDMMVGTMPV